MPAPKKEMHLKHFFSIKINTTEIFLFILFWVLFVYFGFGFCLSVCDTMFSKKIVEEIYQF